MIKTVVAVAVWLSRSFIRYWLTWTWVGAFYILHRAPVFGVWPSAILMFAPNVLVEELPFVAPGVAVYLCFSS